MATAVHRDRQWRRRHVHDPMNETLDAFWYGMYAGMFVVLTLLVVWTFEEARHLTELGDDE
ncbi:unnamed protein product [marine sediment metagenome]|uniref:Uncharacterized protein n=1 Tax=marine sediment metagenome TaxID=412755 RepID=X0UUY9_9ZZZZ